MKRAFLKALFDPKKRVLEKEKIDVCVMPWHYLLATVKTASVAILAFSFSPKVTTGLKAKGFKGDVNLLRDTTSESITWTHQRLVRWSKKRMYARWSKKKMYARCSKRKMYAQMEQGEDVRQKVSREMRTCWVTPPVSPSPKHTRDSSGEARRRCMPDGARRGCMPDGARRRCTPKGFKGAVNLLRDTTSEFITWTCQRSRKGGKWCAPETHETEQKEDVNGAETEGGTGRAKNGCWAYSLTVWVSNHVVHWQVFTLQRKASETCVTPYC